jgi:hypothetical protein
MLRRKSKLQFVNQERNTQNTIALLNYLKHIAPQQLMLQKNGSFKKKIYSSKNASATFLNKKVSAQLNSSVHRIQTWISR